MPTKEFSSMDWMKLKAILSYCAVELVHNNINNIFLWCWNYFLFHKVSMEKLWQYCRSSPGGSDPTISLVSVLEVTILSTISVWSSSNQQNVILIVLGRKYSQLSTELITVLAANAMEDVWEQNTKLFAISNLLGQNIYLLYGYHNCTNQSIYYTLHTTKQPTP